MAGIDSHMSKCVDESGFPVAYMFIILTSGTVFFRSIGGTFIVRGHGHL